MERFDLQCALFGIMNQVGTRSTASDFFEAQIADAVERVPTCKMKTIRTCAMLSIGLWLSAGEFLSAVTFKPLSVPELIDASDLVVRGAVASKSCQRDEAGRIYTKVELDVAETWKGAAVTKKLTVVHGGGILGEERVVVSGQVGYRIGEEVVAFLIFNSRHEAVTVGLAQGKFSVAKDPANGQLVLRNAFYGSSPVGRINLQLDSGGNARRLSLDELRNQVKRSLK